MSLQILLELDNRVGSHDAYGQRVPNEWIPRKADRSPDLAAFAGGGTSSCV